MSASQLTDAELLVLGLVAEMPRHGYQVEQVIDQRSMREWTQIGFSSIYFVLRKLETKKMIFAKRPPEADANSKERKVYSATKAGRAALVQQTLTALSTVRRANSSVLLGMINWPVLERGQALQALHARRDALAAEVTRLSDIQVDQQPLPDFVDALFDHAVGQLTSELDWVMRALDYMATKPWLEGEDADDDGIVEGTPERALPADVERVRLRRRS